MLFDQVFKIYYIFDEVIPKICKILKSLNVLLWADQAGQKVLQNGLECLSYLVSSSKSQHWIMDFNVLQIFAILTSNRHEKRCL